MPTTVCAVELPCHGSYQVLCNCKIAELRDVRNWRIAELHSCRIAECPGLVDFARLGMLILPMIQCCFFPGHQQEVLKRNLGFVEVADGRVSRLHCIISLHWPAADVQPVVLLEDCSSNGTFLNGNKMAKGERGTAANRQEGITGRIPNLNPGP